MTNRIRNVCKRLVMLLSIAALLSCFAVSTGYADALYEWNRSCRRKMSQTTTVYKDVFLTNAIGTVTAGTYVKFSQPGASFPGATIVWMTADGTMHEGYVAPETVGYAVVWYTDADGYRQGIQELQYYEMYGNNAAPGATMDEVRPGYADYTQTGKDTQEGTTSTPAPSTGNQGESEKEETPPSGNTNASDTNASTSSSNTNTSKKNNTTKTSTTKTTISDVDTDVQWQGNKVIVKYWGFYSSVVVADGQTQTVPNAELTFSEKVDTAKRIAYIHAPRTGRCYLRAKGSDKGDILDKCPAGTIVQVVEYGKSYCRIVFEGQVGYVQTACLKFATPATEPMCTWQLSYQGKMTGSAQVPIRNSADNDSSIVVKLRSGTEVTVFAKSGSWYEVEYEGIHGFVHKSFLVMDE